MYQTRFEKRNKKIALDGATSEVMSLVESYNNMIDALEESAQKLASTEREQAWREMAKQVAHEVKNPLTPMRLSVQSFQRKFNPDDKDILKKVDEYSKTLIRAELKILLTLQNSKNHRQSRVHLKFLGALMKGR